MIFYKNKGNQQIADCLKKSFMRAGFESTFFCLFQLNLFMG